MNSTRKINRFPSRVGISAMSPKRFGTIKALFSLLTHTLLLLCASVYLCNSFVGGPKVMREFVSTSGMQVKLSETRDTAPSGRSDYHGIADSGQSSNLSHDESVSRHPGEGLLYGRADWEGSTPQWCKNLKEEPIPNQAVPGRPLAKSRCGRRTNEGECYDGTKVTFFSQHHQDVYLYLRHFRYLNRKGVYLDLAANKHIEISNTFFFDRCLGWRGICVEANPKYFGGLISHRSCQLVPTCVSSKPGRMPFLLDGAVGGIADTLQNGRKSKGTSVDLSCVTLTSIVRRAGVTEIDYLSLDVEGHELEVLKGVDLNEVFIKVITLEAAKNRQAVQHLEAHGYIEHRPKTVEEGAQEGEEFEMRVKFDSIFLHPSVVFGDPN